MFEIESDKEKNRLYIKIEDISETDTRSLIKEITHNVARLKKYFTCLVDIRNMSLRYTEKEKFIMEIIMAGLLDAGMAKVVRLVSKNNKISQIKMENESRALGYRARPAYSLDEAERILDESQDIEQ